MGLDAVELIMRIEEEFSIELPDAELVSVRTVDDLYQLILRRLDTQPSCLSSKAFYRVRKSLVQCLNLPRRAIRPSTPLDPLLPRSSLHQHWQEISNHSGLILPPLKRRRRWIDSYLGPFATSPYTIQTTGDLANLVLYMNYSEFAPPAEVGSRITTEDIWKKVVEIFCDQLGLDPEDVVPSATIADDLGVS